MFSANISEAERMGYISYGDNDPYFGVSNIDKVRGKWGRDSLGKLVDKAGTVPVRIERFANNNQGLPGFKGASEKDYTHHDKVQNKTEYDGYRTESPYPSERGNYVENLHMFEPFTSKPKNYHDSSLFNVTILEFVMVLLLIVCVVYIIILRNNISMMKYMSGKSSGNQAFPHPV
jgi:hypothetical protein